MAKTNPSNQHIWEVKLKCQFLHFYRRR